MPEITNLLENIGLTKSEIKVYLALLELGSSSTGPVVEKSGAASSKIYEVLEKLMQKGLVSFVIKGGVKHYEAASPKRLVDYLKEKEKTIQEQTKSVEALLPELEMKQAMTENKSETLVFKGLKGAQTAFDNILSSCKKSDELIAMGFSDVDETFQNFLIRFHKKRVKHKINFRAVFGPSLQKMVKVLDAMLRTKVKVVPQMGNTVATLVYKDTVLFSMPKDRLWIQVTNQSLADTMRERFEGVWNQKIKVFEGKEALKNLYWQTIDFGEYCALGEGRKIVQTLGENFFIKWQNEKRKRKVVSRIIMGSKHKNLPSVTKAYANFKFIPGYENPGVTLIFNDKVIHANFTDNPTAFLIEDEDTARSQQVHFEQLWNQDTTVMKGWDALLETLNEFVDGIKKGDSFDVIGAAFGVKEKNEQYAKLFAEFDKRRQKKDIHARWLFQQGTNELIEKSKLRHKNGEIKFLPYKNISPVSIYPYKEKTLIMLQGEEPTTITIDNKEISGAFQKQFEQLWNQDTIVVKGWDALLETLNEFIDGIKPGDTFDALGAAFGVKEKNEEYAKLFTEFHKRRKKKNVHARWLFQQGTDTMIEKNRPNYDKGEIKFLPYKNISPVSIYPYKEKTLIMLQGEEPTTITINNKEITSAFQKQFEQQWNQDVIVHKGFEEVTKRFWSMLDEMNPKEEYLVLGASLGESKTKLKKWFLKYHKDRVKQNVHVRLLSTAENEKAVYDSMTKTGDPEMKSSAVRVLPPNMSSQMQFNLYPNGTVLMLLWTKEMVAFEIKSNILCENLKKNFEHLWNQRTITLEGEAAAEHFLNGILKEKEVWFIGGNDGITKYFPQLWKNFNKERIKKKIMWHDLIDTKLIANLFEGQDRSKVKYYEYKTLPPELSSPHVICLYGNKVANIIWAENTVITINEDKQIFDSYRKYFDYLWKGAQ